MAIALSIKINYSEINIKPNLKSDDEGIPYHQAPPKKFDIEIENDKDYIFIEATLINNAEQVPREINKIPRKINEYTLILPKEENFLLHQIFMKILKI